MLKMSQHHYQHVHLLSAPTQQWRTLLLSRRPWLHADRLPMQICRPRQVMTASTLQNHLVPTCGEVPAKLGAMHLTNLGCPIWRMQLRAKEHISPGRAASSRTLMLRQHMQVQRDCKQAVLEAAPNRWYGPSRRHVSSRHESGTLCRVRLTLGPSTNPPSKPKRLF
jgi:hypothetical protein